MPGEVLTYNNVPLHIILEKEISRTHIFSDDGTTYLYTRWVFDVKTYLNPQALSYIQGAAGPSSLPGITDTIIRKLLNQPRRSLTFAQNNTIVLQSPAPGFTVDAKNGPIVESFDLVRDWGTKTWFVFIRLVTHTRECPIVFNPALPNPGPVANIYLPDGTSLLDPRGALVSNRWTRHMDTDEDYISYVETTGECVFDSAWLKAIGAFPDLYRIDLFQPIPPNCKRDNIRVTQMPDGITYRYSYTDQERHFNTLPATRIECYQTEGFSQTAVWPAAFMAAQNISPGAIIGAGVTGGLLAGPFGAVAGAAAATAGQAAGAVWNTALYQVPKLFSHILVKAWGHRGQDKINLLEQAAGMAFERVKSNRFVELIVTFDRAGKYVQVELTNKTGPEEIIPLALNYVKDVAAPVKKIIDNTVALIEEGLQANLDFLKTRPFQFPSGLPAVPPDTVGLAITDSINRVFTNLGTGEDSPNLWYGQSEEDIVTGWQAQAADNEEPVPFLYYGNNQPPFDNATRGTIICNLIAQSLHSPCQKPPCPPSVFDNNGVPITYPPVRTCQTASGNINNPYVPIIPGQFNNPYTPIDPAAPIPPAMPGNDRVPTFDEIQAQLDELNREIAASQQQFNLQPPP